MSVRRGAIDCSGEGGGVNEVVEWVCCHSVRAVPNVSQCMCCFFSGVRGV